MENEDPYETPIVDPVIDSHTDDLAPELVIEHLRKMRPWVNFCSIMGYITSFFLIIIAVISLMLSPNRLQAPHSYLFGLFYLILAILFIIPSIRLSQFERAITKLSITKNLEDLEIATAHQGAFWKQAGIMVAVILFIYLVTIAIVSLRFLAS